MYKMTYVHTKTPFGTESRLFWVTRVPWARQPRYVDIPLISRLPCPAFLPRHPTYRVSLSHPSSHHGARVGVRWWCACSKKNPQQKRVTVLQGAPQMSYIYTGRAAGPFASTTSTSSSSSETMAAALRLPHGRKAVMC